MGRFKTYFRKISDSLDSFSSSELSILEFIRQRKKKIIIYIIIADLFFAAYHYVKINDIEAIKEQKKEAALKIFTQSEFWRKKAKVPFLKTDRFRDETLRKIVPVLKSFVQTNDLINAFIVDPKTKIVLAHSDSKFNNTKYSGLENKDVSLCLMDNTNVEISKHLPGGKLITKVSMVVCETGKSFILKTSAPIPYGKDNRIIGVFIMESPFDDTEKLVNEQKRYLPLVFILLMAAVPGVLSIEYYYRVGLLKEEMAGYDEKYIGPYKNLKPIGEGSMGKVYQATRMLKGKGVGRDVALKVINKNLFLKQDFLDRFKNEARIVARLGLHRNIVGLFDFGQVMIESEESFGLEMPFIDGTTLEKVMENRIDDITTAQAIYISLEILNGLNHAHTLKDGNNEITPVIHRDISPKNIMLSFNGAVMITDFGIAKSNDLGNMTLPGELLGTFTNMSPEQANAESVDCRSDIFSVGTILYELLLKRKLYKADDIRVLWNMVSKAETPEITGIDEQLKSILLKSLAKDPSDRYRTASEMMKDIKDVINHNYKEYQFDEKDMETFLASGNS